MHPCRPVLWAEGTNFVPGYTWQGKIIIRIDVSNEESKDLYSKLLTWMRRAAFPGATKVASEKLGLDMLKSLIVAK